MMNKQDSDVKYTVYLTVAVFVIILGISQGLYYFHEGRQPSLVKQGVDDFPWKSR